jgi:hypothetical protein
MTDARAIASDAFGGPLDKRAPSHNRVPLSTFRVCVSSVRRTVSLSVFLSLWTAWGTAMGGFTATEGQPTTFGEQATVIDGQREQQVAASTAGTGLRALSSVGESVLFLPFTEDTPGCARLCLGRPLDDHLVADGDATTLGQSVTKSQPCLGSSSRLCRFGLQTLLHPRPDRCSWPQR